MTSKKLRWEKHGDVLVGVDQQGWHRAFLVWDQDMYIAVYGYGSVPSIEWSCAFGKNRRNLMQSVEKACKWQNSSGLVESRTSSVLMSE